MKSIGAPLIAIVFCSLITGLYTPDQEMESFTIAMGSDEGDSDYWGFQEGSIYSKQPIDIGYGESHSCAIMVNPPPMSHDWGNGFSSTGSNLTNGTISCGAEPGDPHSQPWGYATVPIPFGRNAIEVSSGAMGACALLDNGSVWCWKSYPHNPNYVNLGGAQALKISASFWDPYDRACAIIENLSVMCWGPGYVAEYMDIGDGNEAVAITGDWGGHCVLLKTQNVSCWGTDVYNTNTYNNLSTPQQIDNPWSAPTIAISGGAASFCSVFKDPHGISGVYFRGKSSSIPYNQHFTVPLAYDNPIIAVSCTGTNTIIMQRICVILSNSNPICLDLDHSGTEGWYYPLESDSSAVGIAKARCILVDNGSLTCWDSALFETPGWITQEYTTWNNQEMSSAPMDIVITSRDPDGDGIISIFDEYPLDPTEWADSDGDGVGDNSDAFPFDHRDWHDGDSDGYGDNTDIFPTDPLEWNDTDGDGMGDNSDLDDDDDGYTDVDEKFNCIEVSDSLNQSSTPPDFDLDLLCDEVDDDDDNDGVADTEDWAPYNSSEWSDTDADGVGDNTDLDDDNDLVLDIDDFCPQGETGWISGAAIGTDYDGDGCRDDGEDTDDDGDGIEDDDDGCPKGNTGWISNPVNDLDGDGCHETEDYDKDGDGFGDIDDSFPEDPEEWNDSDGDGVGDNSDAFPDDSSRWEIGDEDPDEADGGYITVILLGTISLLLVAVVVIVRKRNES